MARMTKLAWTAAAGALAAASSAPAWAEYGDNPWCTNYAWETCTWENGQQVMPTTECLDEEYNRCMAAGWGGLTHYRRD